MLRPAISFFVLSLMILSLGYFNVGGLSVEIVRPTSIIIGILSFILISMYLVTPKDK